MPRPIQASLCGSKHAESKASVRTSEVRPARNFLIELAREKRLMKLPMTGTSIRSRYFRPELFVGIHGRSFSPRTVLVSEQTGIRFKYPVLENAPSQRTYNA